MHTLLIATVVLERSLDRPLDYAIPPALDELVQVGSLVEVPLRASMKKGTVVALKREESARPLKEVKRLLTEDPLLTPDLFKLAEWLESYYCASKAAVLKAVLPVSVRGKVKHKEQYLVRRAKTREELIQLIPGLRQRSPVQAEVLECMLKVQKEIFLTELIEQSSCSAAAIHALAKKGLLVVEKKRLDRSPLQGEEYFPSKPKNLSLEQSSAYAKIVASLAAGQYATHLLFGVTGSGKTEIYLQAIAKALELDKSTLMLVPEISLTPQTIERFRSRFEGNIAVLHHRLSEGERHDEWKRIQRGDAKIVIGARSAIFSPVVNLGLIIIDEEHDNSYKQSEHMPTYHARDVAVMRGLLCQATVILGSATPSIESFYNASIGKYTLSPLATRPENQLMPRVTLIDMRPEYDKNKGYTIFSEALLGSIEKRYKKGEQTILFLNRRGYHTQALCNLCGESVKCPHCALSLTFHKNENHLSCHLCGYQLKPPPSHCPACKSGTPLKFRGMGTEKVEAALYSIFPDIRILRLDADTTRHKGSHQATLRAFRTGKADVLIGTQMVAKGLHFTEVTLVGVLNGDSSLNIPDFRSSENTFQLLTQVAGRAGRGAVQGEVLIQTHIPDNSTIQHAAAQDFESFYKEELSLRQSFLYPPFMQLAKLRFSGKNLAQLEEFAQNVRLSLIRTLPIEYTVTAVGEPGYAKIKDRHQLQFLIKGAKITPIVSAIKNVQQKLHSKDVRLLIDINPTSTFF